jgi:hypothetical protein
MPLQPCPIVTELLSRLAEHMRTQPLLHEDLFDTLEEVMELASENYPDESALRLRGLYLVELVHTTLLFSASGTVPFLRTEQRRMLTSKRFPRSAEGMKALVEYLDNLRDETEVADYAAELANMNTEGLREWGRRQRGVWDDVLTAAIYGASYMEVALEGGQVKWERIGAVAAQALIRASVEATTSMSHARNLLRINLQNGLHPWTPQTRYPE